MPAGPAPTLATVASSRPGVSNAEDRRHLGEFLVPRPRRRVRLHDRRLSGRELGRQVRVADRASVGHPLQADGSVAEVNLEARHQVAHGDVPHDVHPAPLEAAVSASAFCNEWSTWSGGITTSSVQAPSATRATLRRAEEVGSGISSTSRVSVRLPARDRGRRPRLRRPEQQVDRPRRGAVLGRPAEPPARSGLLRPGHSRDPRRRCPHYEGPAVAARRGSGPRPSSAPQGESPEATRSACLISADCRIRSASIDAAPCSEPGRPSAASTRASALAWATA